MKPALLTDITGQDGSYLAELLLSKGCEVYGIIWRASTLKLDFLLSRFINLIDPHAMAAIAEWGLPDAVSGSHHEGHREPMKRRDHSRRTMAGHTGMALVIPARYSASVV